jgi:uroporphyrinogen III methyltransferase/synthase
VTGKVYLVGAGPGDPGLMTLKGAHCLQCADVVLYDSLANERLLDWTRSSCARVLVGKRRGRPTMSQQEIERLMVGHARAGRTVVRLKGGDPFIFGRGGEEAEACIAAGIPFEVVPGVSSAIAGPAYVGIPLTHRDHASSVTFVTGEPGESGVAQCDWGALAKLGGTLVFLMAALRAEQVTEALEAAGLSPATPAAAVRWATTPRQRSVHGTLGDIAQLIGEHGLRPPVLLVIGSVASLAGRLNWYESLPLFGRRIAITRARHQAPVLARALEALGAETVDFPTIEIVEPADPQRVAGVLAEAGAYDWVVLTSANGAERFLAHYLAGSRDIRELGNARLAAIGPATASVLERHHLRVAARPEEYRAEALVEALGDVSGQRILLARAERAREVLPDELRLRGAHVDVVAVYRTVAPSEPVDPAVLRDVDMVTFTSASTVEEFMRRTGPEGQQILARAAVAVIGPVTGAALERFGIAPDVTARPFTIEALVSAIAGYFANRQAGA